MRIKFKIDKEWECSIPNDTKEDEINNAILESIERENMMVENLFFENIEVTKLDDTDKYIPLKEDKWAHAKKRIKKC